MKFHPVVVISACVIAPAWALAQPATPYDPNGYYSWTDREGYYDRDGHYHYYSDANPAVPKYYREGDYERQCRDHDHISGTIFGVAGGESSPKAAPQAALSAGGVILDSALGMTLSDDIDCADHRDAFSAYDAALNGKIGQRYEWQHGTDHGYFVATDAYQDHGFVCRKFSALTSSDGKQRSRYGAACRQDDEMWHFH